MSALKEITTSVRMTIFFWIACGLAYPLIVTVFAQLAFPRQANGSLVTDARGEAVGSALIGQKFTSPRYFHGRPSSIDYKAEASGASQYGATNKKLIERVQGDVTALTTENGSKPTIDLVTTSGSGLDPDITPAGAEVQVGRVGRARNLDPALVRQLVAAHTEGRFLNIFGEPRVNVLALNLALDQLKP
ncbi:K(+)-transporting ATPase subunit C [Gloeobacter kilaueensis]|uniref:Potassium-transporting ATPase KdpC subunit n=1 Tax=Gloeobacter kilaueensis (strain ATCC BAA-2537 / CCAP 1431/1 / ULC 316 / JS1) TaxID=1183438 RepID=U5QMY1_GLOK1|nr:K(+)-transporting ATPase subunit C [Gloeobacter kilaueensis]AGY58954.1 potassium-transporting ATPase subunit C [Gloeobacter kilaueensis JS1]